MPLAAVAMPLTLLLAAANPAASPAPSPSAPPEVPVILFLLDNSASLPPLDPDQKRVEALERVFTFLQGAPYRLILFGGRDEVYVDDVSRYRNDGQWTDLYFAFEKAKELMGTYPEGTDFRVVLLTDGILDPKPADWRDQDVPAGSDLKTYVTGRLLELIKSMEVPLYVILVGELPEGIVSETGELAPPVILEIVSAANGAAGSPMAQSLAAFFEDDGVLLRKFVFRVAPYEGLQKIEHVVRRIVAPASVGVELQFLGGLVLPLFLFLFLLIGILVRSFPGPGDAEIVELTEGVPTHVVADRPHKVEGGWATSGLALTADAKGASASLTYRVSPLDLSGTGLDTSGLDPQSLSLLSLELPELKGELERFTTAGSKEEKIYAMNLDYMAKSFDGSEAERILTSDPANRQSVPALDYLRAKAHLLFDQGLHYHLTQPRVQLLGYGKNAGRMDLLPGATPRIGRYGFVVMGVDPGGRRDVRLVLNYDKVPSLLGMKNWLPSGFQRLFRLRRSSHRVVS